MKLLGLLSFTLIGWSSIAIADERDNLSQILVAGLAAHEKSCLEELSSTATQLFEAFKDSVVNPSEPRRVLETFTAYVNAAGESPWAVQMLPEILIHAHQYNDALRAIAYGEEKSYDDFPAIRWLQFKVRVFEAQHRYEEGLKAVREFQRKVKAHPIASAAEAGFLLLSRNVEALQVLEKAAPAWPRNNLLAEMLMATRKTANPDRREELIREITQLNRDKKFNTALEKLNELEQITGSDFRYFRILKLDALAGIRSDVNAIAMADLILATQPNNVIVRMRRAISLLNLNRFRDARNELDRALKYERTNIALLFLRARALRRLREYNAALADLSLLLDLTNGRDIRAIELVLEILNVSYRGKEVDTYMAKVPADFRNHTLLATADLIKGDFNSALKRISILKDSTNTRWLKAWAYFGLENWQASYDVLLSMLTMERSKNFWPLVGLIYLEGKLPDMPRTNEFERELIMFDASRRDAMLTLAEHFRFTRLTID